jgi:predicted DNA-binding protein YlxM (UPF0122 family)
MLTCQGMSLDALASRERHVELFECYGALLTDRQRRILELNLQQDLSLSEIAEMFQISRAAVHDLLCRSQRSLEQYEQRLGLAAMRLKVDRALEEMRKSLDNLAQAVRLV